MFSFEIFFYFSNGLLTVASLFGWMTWITFIVAFYINAYYLVPRMLAKKQFGRYVLHVLSLAAAGLILMFFHRINPLGDYAFVYFGGDWNVVDLENITQNYYRFGNEIGDFVGILIAILIASIIYGVGRHLLTKRIPQLTTKSETLTAELNTLKHQMSPHFFFNSLNTVYSFSLSEDSPKTAEAVSKLSDLMRFVIYQSNQEKIDLSKEIDYLSDYIELQRLRLDSKKHELIFQVEGDPQALQIAPLMLITSIENAFKHGLSMNQFSYIHIHLMILEAGLILTVVNSNHAALVLEGGGQAEAGGLGMLNTRKRLELLYAKKYDWQTEDRGDHFFSQLSIDLV